MNQAYLSFLMLLFISLGRLTASGSSDPLLLYEENRIPFFGPVYHVASNSQEIAAFGDDDGQLFIKIWHISNLNNPTDTLYSQDIPIAMYWNNERLILQHQRLTESITFGSNIEKSFSNLKPYQQQNSFTVNAYTVHCKKEKLTINIYDEIDEDGYVYPTEVFSCTGSIPLLLSQKKSIISYLCPNEDDPQTNSLVFYDMIHNTNPCKPYTFYYDQEPQKIKSIVYLSDNQFLIGCQNGIVAIITI